jgi:hypothetical protein
VVVVVWELAGVLAALVVLAVEVLERPREVPQTLPVFLAQVVEVAGVM